MRLSKIRKTFRFFAIEVAEPSFLVAQERDPVLTLMSATKRSELYYNLLS